MLLLCFPACKNDRPPRKTARAFYYWKSVFAPTAFEKRRADSLGIMTLYLKLFDVVWNKTTRAAEPAAKLLVRDTAWLLQKNIVPVVFITNECLYGQDSAQTQLLAMRIARLANKLAAQNGFGEYRQLQIDCDWSATTRERYFQLLRAIKAMNGNRAITATIRLHQVKYQGSSGIPPVDRGLLMCYNMGDLQQEHTRNSIIDAGEFQRYVRRLSTYPLPLDAGLPLFSWTVVFDQGRYAGLIRNMPAIPGSNAFEPSGTGYRALKDTLLGGRQVKRGQVLRPENSDFSTVMAVGRSLSGKIRNQELTVALYHLDSLTLNKYSFYELEDIFSSLH
ncbi:hypothetical protein [Niabella aurantiaca]|uniref:hypothetical protein n=1 Tax=Niabella aurantiaca TaxID=379900 RepID=UPI0012F7275F|nr:hypothetical protein [Niabella aurantiaca]